MENKDFTVLTRYSDTEASDKHERWARLIYFKGTLISWINRIDHIDYGRFYTINDFSPSIQQSNPCYSGKDTDYDKILSDAQIRFLAFLNACNK